MEKQINVLYVFDDNYAPYAGISINSLLTNVTRESRVTFYLAGLNIGNENEDKINATVADYNQTVVWLDTNEAQKIINSCGTGEWNGSKATWLKVFVIWQLPEDVHSILYIDSDSLVLGDISNILHINLENYPVAMALDPVGFRYGTRLGLPKYYNAGVVFFNVDYWKKTGMKDNFIKHFKKNVKNYPANEQCLLNDYFNDKILRLPLEYNTQGFLLLYSEKEYFSAYHGYEFYTESEIAKAKGNPIIIHFFRIMGDYPWEEGNVHPAEEQFLEWKSKSYWKDLPMVSKKCRFIFRIEKIMLRILPKKVFIKIYKMIVDRTY